MRPARRGVLAALGAGAGAVLTAATPAPASSAPASAWPGTRAAAPAGHRAARALAALEREHGARLGVYALDTGTGRAVTHRADELFPMCSLFKTLAAAAVLRDLDRDGSFLDRRLHYTQEDIDRSGYSKWTEREDNLANGLTIGELCRVSITYSDNTAANLLLRELGGPSAITRFARSLGDRVTRLDRWEPDLNSAEPDRVTDVTTPPGHRPYVRPPGPGRRARRSGPLPADRMAAREHDERQALPERAAHRMAPGRQDGRRLLRHEQRRRRRVAPGRGTAGPGGPDDEARERRGGGRRSGGPDRNRPGRGVHHPTRPRGRVTPAARKATRRSGRDTRIAASARPPRGCDRRHSNLLVASRVGHGSSTRICPGTPVRGEEGERFA